MLNSSELLLVYIKQVVW